ncbi:MAG: 4Fe-4S dicluster domain-containing protein [Candidatus Jordarchaeaceae archaeon]
MASASPESEASFSGNEIINISQADQTFLKDLENFPGGEALRLCYQCGVCISSCPVARYLSEYKPAQIVRMAVYGLKEKLFASRNIWLCSTCYACLERCPQGVKPADIIRSIANLAFREGIIHIAFKEAATNILTTGRMFEVPEIRKKKREKVGLPKLPEVNIDEVKKLLKSTGLEERLSNAKRVIGTSEEKVE